MLCLFLAWIMVGCQSSNSDQQAIVLDPTEAEEATLMEVFPDFEAVNITLPDSVFIGGITQIKTHADHIFLLDEYQSRSIIILNQEGNFINQLKNIGQGPGEYSAINAFAISPSGEELLIYDRSRSMGFTYGLPNLNFLESKKLNAYLMNIEFIDDDHLFVVRDDEVDQETMKGLEVWNRDFEVVAAGISDQYNAVIELSYPNTVGTNGSELLYAHPYSGKISVLQPAGLQPFMHLDPAAWGIPTEMYTLSDAMEFEEKLARGKYMLWFRLPRYDQQSLSFWYMYGMDEDANRFARYDVEAQAAKSFKQILLAEEGQPVPVPLGVNGNEHIALVWPEMEESSGLPSRLKPIYESAMETEIPFLLYLK